MDIKELHSVFDSCSAVCTDSRNIIPDSMFFALKGDNFDGNSFVRKALEEGCAFAVSDDPANDGIHGCILVDNVLKTLQDLAEYHRMEFNIPVVAITGTNGKTTTKELVNAVLSGMYRTVCTEGNLNNHIGVPLTLLKITRDAEIVIVEMGANHPGEIAGLCRIAHPDKAIVTNIGKAHLEGFVSPEGVRKAKGELFDFVEKNRGVIFYNSDDSTVSEMAEATRGTTLVKYGKTAAGAKIDDSSMLLRFSTLEPEMSVDTALAGEYNLNNALAAIAVGRYFGVSAVDVAEALTMFRPADNRSQLIKTAQNTVILDAYNANPSSMEAAICNFGKLDAKNKMLILGDMLELGEAAVDEHKKIVEILKRCNLWEKGRVVLVGQVFGQLGGDVALCFGNRLEACKFFEKQPPREKTVLVKGSRGTGLEILLKYL
jgi:UDP-N-acetylmuramoyl-tripeptide--D-alanyl-D-alanine ligase